MSSNEWMPAQIPFDLVRRGFAPDQVTAHLERLEYDLRIATANSEATNQRLSEVSAQLSATQADADELRAQLDQLAREPMSMTGLSNRMQRMIRLAEEEASEIRARAGADAEKIRAQAAAIAASSTAERDAFDAEREKTRRQLAEQVRELLSEATAEAESTRATAQREAESTLGAARAQASQLLTSSQTESDSTLRAARGEAESTLRSARAEAEHTLRSAREESESLISTATAERDRLDSESNARRTQIEEDFEIAMSARRNEAHQRLTELEEISNADAKHRVEVAAAEAQRLEQEATDRSAALIRRTAAESHQRVAEADSAIRALASLRSQLLGQLRDLRTHLGRVDELVGSAPSLVDPPAQEENRPVTDDFPINPQSRPTALPDGYEQGEPGPWDEVTIQTLRADQGEKADDADSGAPQRTADGTPAGVTTGSEKSQGTRAEDSTPKPEGDDDRRDSADASEAAEAVAGDRPTAADEHAETATDKFPRVEDQDIAAIRAALPEQHSPRGSGQRGRNERTKTGGGR